MRAIILAAGRGSRMSYMTENNPKCMIKFNNKTLLKRQVEIFRSTGIKDIGIVTGYNSSKIQEENLYQFHNDLWDKTQMVYSLSCADKWLKEYECIICYSDIFFEKSAVSSLLNDKSNFAITYDPNWYELWSKRFEDPLDDAESFILDSNNLVSDIGRKVKTLNEIEGQYMGLIKLTPFSYKTILQTCLKMHDKLWTTMHMTELMQLLIKEKILKLNAIPYFGLWGEIDSISDLQFYSNEKRFSNL